MCPRPPVHYILHHWRETPDKHSHVFFFYRTCIERLPRTNLTCAYWHNVVTPCDPHQNNPVLFEPASTKFSRSLLLRLSSGDNIILWISSQLLPHECYYEVWSCFILLIFFFFLQVLAQRYSLLSMIFDVKWLYFFSHSVMKNPYATPCYDNNDVWLIHLIHAAWYAVNFIDWR